MAVSFTSLGANYGNTATLFIASFIATSSPATSKPFLDRSGMCCNHCSPVSCSHWSSIRSLKSRLAISPPMLFFLAGTVCWSYFQSCVTQTASTFSANAGIFDKVYFPRLAVPISQLISNLIGLAMQMVLFLIFYVYFFEFF